LVIYAWYKNDAFHSPAVVFNAESVKWCEERKNRLIHGSGKVYGEEWMKIANEGYAFFKCISSDMILLDISPDNKGKIRYCTVDGMGKGGYHGVVLANSLDEFFEKWYSVGFGDPGLNFGALIDETKRAEKSWKFLSWLGLPSA
jgi:hypothetical protein